MLSVYVPQGASLARIPVASFQRAGEVKHFNLEFFDDAGRKIAELENFCCKDVRDPQLITTTNDVAGVDEQEELSLGDVPRAENNNPVGEHSSARTGIEQLLRQMIADKLQKSSRQIRINAGYYELGLKSRALLELVHALERALGDLKDAAVKLGLALKLAPTDAEVLRFQKEVQQAQALADAQKKADDDRKLQYDKLLAAGKKALDDKRYDDAVKLLSSAATFESMIPSPS